ncbi:hypothetical protein [Rhodoferax saidenbachensis]|uniref:Glycosyltransferase RgtA/B/C/D-like domain-containing protein n=1 Tax=Rhodoferax saidenbachensis TaxID=1484693 RepID=A0A1P8K6C2_9BURK|nr:hypothetical protein [Rhodoferax saidenbachensis]APW41544.1 hypothetical protein RS694_02575 [Rhodoferax saidenbachensis]
MVVYLLDMGYESSLRGLDLSWHVMLGYAYENKLQRGTQIIFNYGPLSFIESGIYFEQSHVEKLLYRAVYLLTLGVGCFSVLRIRSVWALLAWCGLTLYLIMWRDVYLLLPALLLCHHECRRQPGNGAQLALSILLAFGAAFACLVKANAMFFTVPAIVLASIYRFTVRDYRPIVPVCFVLSTLLLFWLSGQELSGFFEFLRGYVDVSRAYNADMGLPAPWALHAAFVVGAAAVVAATLRLTSPASTVLSLLTLGYLLVAYKMGFVRHGEHPQAAFLALAVISAIQLWTPSSDVLGRNQRWVLAAVAIAAAAFVASSAVPASLPPYGDANKGFASVLQYRVRYLLDPTFRAAKDFEERRRFAVAFDAARSAIPFDAIEGPVDVFPFEFSLAYASGLPIATRPAFQSYFATSRYMTERNAEFLASPQAPRSVIFSIVPMDGRYAALEDPLTVGAYRRYYQVDRQKPDALLLTRRAHPLTQSQSCWHMQADVNQPLPVPAIRPDQAVWAHIALDPNWVGQVTSVLTGPPVLRMAVTTSAGRSDFRFLREAGEVGFLLSPTLGSTEAAARFFKGESRPEERVLSLMVLPADGLIPAFGNRIPVKLCVLSWAEGR